MNKITQVLNIWRIAFKNWKYWILTLIVGFLFYMINGFILNVRNLGSIYEALGFSGLLKFLFNSSLYFLNQVTLSGAIGSIVLSFFVGIMVSLLAYRYKIMKESSGEKLSKLGSLGVFFGVAAPGCAACGVGLISLIGLGGALTSLPFQGAEIIFIAIILVVFAIIDISLKLNRACSINLDGKLNLVKSHESKSKIFRHTISSQKSHERGFRKK